MFMILAPRAVPTGPPKFTSQAHPENSVPAEAASTHAEDDEPDEHDEEAPTGDLESGPESPPEPILEIQHNEHPSQDDEPETDAGLEQTGEHATGVATSA